MILLFPVLLAAVASVPDEAAKQPTLDQASQRTGVYEENFQSGFNLFTTIDGQNGWTATPTPASGYRVEVNLDILSTALSSQGDGTSGLFSAFSPVFGAGDEPGAVVRWSWYLDSDSLIPPDVNMINAPSHRVFLLEGGEVVLGVGMTGRQQQLEYFASGFDGAGQFFTPEVFIPLDRWVDFEVRLRSDATFTVWMDGAPIINATALSLRVDQFQFLNTNSRPGGEMFLDDLSVGPLPYSDAFTYQGHLRNGATPADGAFDIRFDLYDAEAGGTLLSTSSKTAVPVVDGLFTVELEFAFGLPRIVNENRYLEIIVEGNTLTPRQPITPAPAALVSRDLDPEQLLERVEQQDRKIERLERILESLLGD